MRYADFLRHVEARAAGGLSSEGAERAVAAVLRTLGERISAEEAEDLAAQLPVELKQCLPGVGAGQRFGVEEYLRRVAAREDATMSEGLHHSRAVLDVLRQAVTQHELDAVRAQLPDEFATLFRAPAVARWPDEHRHHDHR